MITWSKGSVVKLLGIKPENVRLASAREAWPRGALGVRRWDRWLPSLLRAPSRATRRYRLRRAPRSDPGVTSVATVAMAMRMPASASGAASPSHNVAECRLAKAKAGIVGMRSDREAAACHEDRAAARGKRCVAARIAYRAPPTFTARSPEISSSLMLKRSCRRTSAAL